MNITDIVAKLLYYSSFGNLVLRLRKVIKKNEIILLGYHRICSKDSNDGLFNSDLISCAEEQFEKEVKFLKNNFDILTFKDLDALGTNRGRYRIAIITFDDGYLDNYLKAYPILKNNNVSAVFFIVPGVIDGFVEPWWELLAYYNKLDLISEIMSMAPSALNKKMSEINEESNLIPLRKGYFIDKFMNWEQISEMHNNGMEIGCHTYSHYILSRCNNSEKIDEIIKAKDIIEDKINDKIVSFAYPIGSTSTYNEECITALKQMEIQYAITYNNSTETYPFRNKYMIGRLQSEYYGRFYHFQSRIALPEIIRW